MPRYSCLIFLLLTSFSESSGSPDAGGYYWTSSENEPTMDFNWIDIQGIGSQVQFPTNDAAGSPISIGFNFPFMMVNILSAL